MRNPKQTTFARRLGLAIVLGLALASAGCKSTRLPAYTAGPGPHAQTREVSGLFVTADPFVDQERAKTYFKIDPAVRSIAIIYLRAENRSTDATWLLCDANISLADAGGNSLSRAQNQGLKSDRSAAEAVGMAGAVLVSFPLLIASGKMTQDALMVDKNFVDKVWRNQTLSPGQSADGFIYISYNKQAGLPRDATLRIDTLNTRAQQPATLIIPLVYETK